MTAAVSGSDGSSIEAQELVKDPKSLGALFGTRSCMLVPGPKIFFGCVIWGAETEEYLLISLMFRLMARDTSSHPQCQVVEIAQVPIFDEEKCVEKIHQTLSRPFLGQYSALSGFFEGALSISA